MKKVIVCVFLTIASSRADSQQFKIDSFHNLLSGSSADTHRISILYDFSLFHYFKNGDSAMRYADEAMALARRLEDPANELKILELKSNLVATSGDLPGGLALAFKGLDEANKKGYEFLKATFLHRIGNIFTFLNDYQQALNYHQQAQPIFERLSGPDDPYSWKQRNELNMGRDFMRNGQLDSAVKYIHAVYLTKTPEIRQHASAAISLGDIFFQQGRTDSAIRLLHESLTIFENIDDKYFTAPASLVLAGIYKEINSPDSAIYYARKSITAAKDVENRSPMLRASKLLAELYETVDMEQALHFRKLYDSTNNIIYGPEKVLALQKTLASEQERQRKIESERIAASTRLKMYGLLSGVIILALIAFLLYRNNIQRKKSNKLLHLQKEKVEATLQELKATQAQLIQSEKMASLGELTAGIAHEIQNPLNFVNNFSEVNDEMLGELKNQNSNLNEEEQGELLDYIFENNGKINFHGKRADAIVKNMLEHSRSGRGEKQLTDINALCDEYLRLTYQSAVSKDPEFNCELKTDFEEGIGKIDIIPQDIGRVLLNFFNNAFYACAERSRSAVNERLRQAQPDSDYKPALTVFTKKINGQISVGVKDNGNGIPNTIKEKIFQPFFTTKPTGQGTGLGLSLSYDIIKAHGGEIKVESKQEEGTVFIVNLPFK